MVHFDSSQKIQQIRLYWDQGSLLKHVDVIGGRARNWPIHDGKDQAKLIATSVTGTTQSAGPGRPSTQAARDPDEVVITTNNTTKPRSQSKNVTRDPHASLSLFALVGKKMKIPRRPKLSSLMHQLLPNQHQENITTCSSATTLMHHHKQRLWPLRQRKRM